MFELIPYAGYNPINRLRREMDDILGAFFDGEKAPSRAPIAQFVPRVDIEETEDAVVVTAEVPGLKANDIEVTLTGDILTLKGEKKSEREEVKGAYHVTERAYGSFQRSFRLPVEVDRKKLNASHKDGVLTVTLPKGEKEGSTTIKVKSA